MSSLPWDSIIDVMFSESDSELKYIPAWAPVSSWGFNKDMNTYCFSFSCSSSRLWRKISLATLPPSARIASLIFISCFFASKAIALFQTWRVWSFSYEAIQTSYIFDSHIKEYKTENLALVPLSEYKFVVDFSEAELTVFNIHSSHGVLRCRKLWIGQGYFFTLLAFPWNATQWSNVKRYSSNQIGIKLRSFPQILQNISRRAKQHSSEILNLHYLNS